MSDSKHMKPTNLKNLSKRILKTEGGGVQNQKKNFGMASLPIGKIEENVSLRVNKTTI